MDARQPPVLSGKRLRDQMIHTYCPIDGSDDHDVELFPANFDPAAVNASHFSARRIPDRVHYRMVRNRLTGCIRADPILPFETINQLYEKSRVTYDDLSQFTTATYLSIVENWLNYLPDRTGLLEIGAGAGWFLEAARSLGFKRAVGIEPSRDAVAKASPSIRSALTTGVLEPGFYPPSTFSLVCGFQVLDHLPDPNGVLSTVQDLLVPGGLTLWICHDAGAPLNRLLGRLSPIVDIEHVVLYDRRTIRKLFERNGFEILDVFGIANRYPLWYWTQLAPMPRGLRNLLVRLTRLSTVALRMNLGNMGIVARKAAK
jgi:SAM-dependent methyltransferase